MERSTDLPSCEHCGTSGGGPNCSTCGRPVEVGAGLRLVPGGAVDGGEMPEAHLVREYKGPTVQHLLAAAPQALDRLPGRVRSMADAVESEDWQAAAGAMDEALAEVLPGPGYRSKVRPVGFRAVLWLWFGVITAVLSFLVWW